MNHLMRWANLLLPVVLSACATTAVGLADGKDAGQQERKVSASIARPSRPEPKEAIAARRLGEAIQATNWSTTTEHAARESIESAIRPFGWTFEQFDLRPLDIDSPQRLVSDLIGPKCLGAKDWVAGLGRPRGVKLLELHYIRLEEEPGRVDRLINGTEKGFHGPMDVIYYSIRNQPKYQMLIVERSQCFHRVLITKLSQ